MSKTPSLKSKDVIKALTKAGFQIIRQSGSHVRLQHLLNSEKQTTVPLHNTDIPRWLLQKILQQAKISLKELLKFLKE